MAAFQAFHSAPSTRTARFLAAVVGLWLATCGLAILILVGSLAAPRLPPLPAAATPEVAVFPKAAATRERLAALNSEIAALSGVAAIRLVAGEDALADALRRAGAAGAAPPARTGLVPDFFVVRLDPTQAVTRLEATVAALGKLAQVDAVVGDLAWLRQWQTLRAQVEAAAQAVGVAAAVAASAALAGATLLLAGVPAPGLASPGRPAGSRRIGRAAWIGAAGFALAAGAALAAAHWLAEPVRAVWTTLAPIAGLAPAPSAWSPGDLVVFVVGASAAGAVAVGLGRAIGRT